MWIVSLDAFFCPARVVCVHLVSLCLCAVCVRAQIKWPQNKANILATEALLASKRWTRRSEKNPKTHNESPRHSLRTLCLLNRTLHKSNQHWHVLAEPSRGQHNQWKCIQRPLWQWAVAEWYLHSMIVLSAQTFSYKSRRFEWRNYKFRPLKHCCTPFIVSNNHTANKMPRKHTSSRFNPNCCWCRYPRRRFGRFFSTFKVAHFALWNAHI